MKRNYQWIFFAALIINLLVIICAYFSFSGGGKVSALQQESPQFIAICNYAESVEWAQIKQGLESAAAEAGVAIEYIESVFSGEEADSDSIRMAVASSVDGIAIFPMQGNISEDIAYAASHNIPVATLMYDETQSSTDIFIGVDDNIYGELVRRTIREVSDTREVGLLNGQADNSNRRASVEEILQKDYELYQSRSSAYIFDVSEALKEMLINHSGLELIYCMDTNTTLGASQAIIDWNMVGKVNIIGTGDAEDTRSLVERGVISAAIVTDCNMIGRKAVEALCDSCRSMAYQGDDADIQAFSIKKESLKAFPELLEE